MLEHSDGEENPAKLSENVKHQRKATRTFENIYLGSPQNPSTIELLKVTHSYFMRKMLINFFKSELSIQNIPVPEDIDMQITHTHKARYCTV